MRRIAFINQKGGVGKTTSTANVGAALAREGRRVVLVDLDPQANLSIGLDVQLRGPERTTYAVLIGDSTFAQALRDTRVADLRLVASSLDLSGAELELANAIGREMLLRDAIDQWEGAHRREHGESPADFLLIDCPPSLGLLSINGLVAAHEAIIVVQTEFFALQGLSKLVEIVQLLRRRLNPRLEVAAILACLYDNRLKLAREVLGELRAHFPGKVLRRPIAKNVKLAEAPSYGQTIFEYAPESGGAIDYLDVARELIERGDRTGATAAGTEREVTIAPRPPAAERSAAIEVAAEAPAAGEPTARARRR
jgi:chromosome partitioning protein